MKLARLFVVAGVVAGSAFVAAPSASACAGTCLVDCVEYAVDNLRSGDLNVACPM